MKICVARIDRMGDMILSLPAIKGIKIQNPDCQIHVLASKDNIKVLKNLKYIDKVILINSSSLSIFKELINIRKTKYDYFINLSPKVKSYILCFFSKSINKAIIIFQTRYKKKYFSKFFLKFITSFFCKYKHNVDRFDRLSKNQEIHQTKMIFNLLDFCKIKFTSDLYIDIDLPEKKINHFNEKLILIHLSERWVNSNYTEDELIQLILLLKEKKFSVVLTTDNSTKNKFKKIYDGYKILNNSEFKTINYIEDDILILDNLDFEPWVQMCYSASAIITPECGCTHIAAACKVPVNVIYDPKNYPEAIHKEYAPWKSQYNNFVFGEKNLNKKLIEKLDL